jgi:hypothetical protein
MPLTPEAVQAVHRFSGGTPRVINTLCDNALFEGYVARAPVIDEKMIERVAIDLGLEGGATPEAPPAALAGSAQKTSNRGAGTAVPPRVAAAAEAKAKAIDLGEIDKYLAGLAKPSQR